jgi:hypothetical protein
MSIDLLDQKVLNELPPLSEVNTNYGVKLNALTVDQLFDLYQRTGFLYPAKAARLLPYMDLVRDNWRRLLEAQDSLLYLLTAGEEGEGCASIAVWRTTERGWTSQHLVSQGNPLGTRSVILAGSAASMRRGTEESHQNWFRPENRFPSRVFGSMVQTVGEAFASVKRHMYFAFRRNLPVYADKSVKVIPCTRANQDALSAFAVLVRGTIYVIAEELARDLELKRIDDLYRTVGLRRTRQVWLAYRRYNEEPIGAVIAYRGPLGVNFSYIENRCDLLLDPTLPQSDVLAVVSSLLSASAPAYADFELNEIPVIADEIAAPALTQLGAEFLRHYCQGIWLNDGQPRFYRHVDSFYSRLLHREENHINQATLSI